MRRTVLSLLLAGLVIALDGGGRFDQGRQFLTFCGPFIWTLVTITKLPADKIGIERKTDAFLTWGIRGRGERIF